MGPLRAFYFFNFGALGALFPFLPLLLASRGLTPGEIALVLVISPAAGLAVPPLWGSLADALGGRLLLLRIAALGSAATCLLLLPDWGLSGALVAMVAFSIFRVPLTSLSDAAAFDVLGGAAGGFSRIRVFGSLGFVAFVVLLGQLDGSSHPRLLLGIAAAAHVASALVTLPLGAPPLRRRPGAVRDAAKALSSLPLTLFLAGTAVYYAGHSMYDAFFGLHARAIGGSDGFIGVAWAAGVTAEIGLMLLAPRLMRRGRSVHFLLVASAAATIRWALLAFFEDQWAVLATQPLHGLTFGLFYLALANYAQNRAPEGLRTSLQSVALAAMGAGQLVGYLWGGRLFDREGGLGLFLAAAGLAALAGAIWLAALVADRGSAPSPRGAPVGGSEAEDAGDEGPQRAA